MTDSRPEISVLMPTYNAERFVRTAVESVLAQTFDDFELLIVDDGSTDNTAEIISAFADPRIRLVKKAHTGVADTLRAGVESARGKYIARMDADDIAFPDRLQKQYAVLESDPDIFLVHTAVSYIDDQGTVLQQKAGSESDPVDVKWLLLWRNVPFHPTVVFRRDALAANNINYRSGLSTAEDFALWNEARECGEFHYLDDVTLYYRVHTESVTGSTRNASKQLAVLSSIIGSNLARLGVTVSGDEARELAVLTGGTAINPIHYRYTLLGPRLPDLLEQVLAAYAVRTGLSGERLMRAQMRQSLTWSRYLLGTSRAASFKLLTGALRSDWRTVMKNNGLLLMLAIMTPPALLRRMENNRSQRGALDTGARRQKHGAGMSKTFG